jgi:hypothetical protein
VTLAEPLEYSYNTASGALAHLVTPAVNIRLRDLVVIASPSAAGTGTLVRFNYCRKVLIGNCEFVGFKLHGVHLTRCIDVSIVDCAFDDGGTSSDGIYADDISRDVRIRCCEISRCRIGIAAGVACRYISIDDCRLVAVDCGIAFGLSHHFSAHNNSIICTGSGASALLGSGIYISGDEFTISGNDIKNPSIHGIYADNAVTFDHGSMMHTGIIANNRVFEADDDGIYAKDYDTISIHNNHVTTGSATSRAIYTEAVAADIHDNVLAAFTGSYGIRCVGVSNTRIHGNLIEDGTFGYAITVVNAAAKSGLQVTNNRIYRPSTACIYIDGSTGTTGLSGVSISGNVCDCDATSCVELVNRVKYAVISGNVFIGNDSDPILALAGDAAGSVDEVIFTSNMCKDGTYMIGEATDANNTNVLAQGNIALSMATATFQGTIDNELAADDHNAT